MDDRPVYSRKEMTRLRQEAAGGRRPICPRCDQSLVPRAVPSRSDVAYVRARVWWLCEGCGRSAVLDVRSPRPGAAEEAQLAGKSDLRPLLGWREWVGLPGLGIGRIKAKVDTGARSSALHAVEVEEVRSRDDVRLRFTVYPLQRTTATAIRVEAPLVDRRPVRSSSGRQELRPVVRVEVEVAGNRYHTEFTLARRDQMGFRMLLGRTALRRRFLVDPGRSFLQSRTRS